MAAKKIEAERAEKKDVDEIQEPTLVLQPSGPVAPDGGYGWVILLASLMINIIVDGIIFNFGMLSKELERQFGSSTSATAWVGSMMAGFYLLAGPVVSGLCTSYGARRISVIGSFIAAGSIAISAFSTGLTMMLIFYGLFAGIGFGFIYLPAIVIVGEYFEKRRALATGLAVSGSGIGGFSFAYLFEYLVDEYGVQGTILIIAGIALNCAVFGALFKPVSSIRRSEPEGEVKRSESFIQRIEDAKNARIRKLNADSQVDGLDIEEAQGTRHPLLHEEHHLTRIPEDGLPLPDIDYEKGGHMERKMSNTSIHKSHPSILKPDTFYPGSLQNLPEVKAMGSIRSFREAVSMQQLEKIEGGEEKKPSNIAAVFKQMLDLSLLRNPVFLLTCISSFLTLAGFFIPFVYMRANVEATGIDEASATQILSAISITNTIGRIVVGFFTDMPCVSPIVVACSSLIVGGIVTCFVPFYAGYWVFMIYALVFGFCIAAFAALRSIILVDLFGIALLNNSFGLQMTFQGLATLIGSPIAGAIKDATGAFDGTFYFGGALLALSGLILFPAKLLQQWVDKRKK